MKDQWCDLCAAKGLKKKLQFCRVNFEEGLVLCENTMCMFPFGSTDVQSLLVKKEIETAVRNKKREPSSLKEKAVQKEVHSSPKTLPSQFYWCNADSLCWLDSVLAVLVNNKCLRLCLQKLQGNEYILQKVCNAFNAAQKCGPGLKGSTLLNEARNNVFDFLKPKMQCTLGVNDCPLTTLSLLLKENVYICEKFMLEYHWRFACEVCGYGQIDRFKKLVVSFPNTTEEFSMPSGYFLRPCYKCKASGQRSTLDLQQMPPCVMVHFVEGVRNKEFLKSQFSHHGTDYELCQIIQYKRNPDHFVSWVRNSNGTHWAEVDDMNDKACTWKEEFPSLPAKQIHIALWERTSLCRKICPTTEATTKMATTHTMKPTQIPHEAPSSTCTSPLRVRVLKDPPLPQRIPLECKASPKLNNNSALCKTPKETYSEKSSPQVGEKKNNFSNFLDSPSLNNSSAVCKTPKVPHREKRSFCGNFDSTTESSKCHVGEKRTDLGNFQPYIPRKKRSVSHERERSVAQSCSRDDTVETKSSLESVAPKTFLPWQDAISVDSKEKQKQCVGDNQSDSGYSSPGSNSSCVSITMPSVKEESNLAEFLQSLETLELPNRKKSLIGEPVSVMDNKGSKGNKGTNGDIDDILGEMFSPGGFQGDISLPGCNSTTAGQEALNGDHLQWLDSTTNFDDFLFGLSQ